jgi:hypothetical protein
VLRQEGHKSPTDLLVENFGVDVGPSRDGLEREMYSLWLGGDDRRSGRETESEHSERRGEEEHDGQMRRSTSDF